MKSSHLLSLVTVEYMFSIIWLTELLRFYEQKEKTLGEVYRSPTIFIYGTKDLKR